MSMISSLIDELNKSADEWNGSNMFELARMCREAADAIWQLRDDLQRANAENAKLREEFNKMDVWHSKELTASMAENAKLRELVRHMHTCMEHYEMDGTISCDRCPLDNDTGNCDFERRMRELGGGGGRMTATDELLPCPFCGGDVFMMQHPKGFWTVEHKDVNFECPFHMAFFDTKEEAVERWNRRADHD